MLSKLPFLFLCIYGSRDVGVRPAQPDGGACGDTGVCAVKTRFLCPIGAPAPLIGCQLQPPMSLPQLAPPTALLHLEIHGHCGL